jgi:hypothetical protein
MDRSDFRGSLFSNFHLGYGSMEEIILDGAFLCTSNFSFTDFLGSSFVGVDLRSTKLYAVDCSKSNFDLCLFSQYDTLRDLNQDIYFGSLFENATGSVFLDSKYIQKFHIKFYKTEDLNVNGGKYDSIFKFKKFKLTNQFIDSLKKDILLRFSFEKFKYITSVERRKKLEIAITGYFEILKDLKKIIPINLKRYCNDKSFEEPFIESDLNVWDNADTIFAENRKRFIESNPQFSKSMGKRCITTDVFYKVLNKGSHN